MRHRPNKIEQGRKPLSTSVVLNAVLCACARLALHATGDRVCPDEELAASVKVLSELLEAVDGA